MGVLQGEIGEYTLFQSVRMTLLANVYLLGGRIEEAFSAAQSALKLARR